MLLRQPRPDERDLTYREWLDRRITRTSSPELYAFFERLCHFSVSIDLDDITYGEVVETMKNMFRYGPPGIVDGGCAALTGELERRVLAAGGAIWLEQDALEVLERWRDSDRRARARPEERRRAGTLRAAGHQ